MTSPLSFEGHAIVSADGMIADAAGLMPPPLRNDADWRLFQAALDRAALVVLGRLGHERHPNPGRRRLVLTSQVTDLQADPADPRASLWNPAGTELGAVLRALGVTGGSIAVTGGTRVFDYFLPWYTEFSLSEVPALTLEGGTPTFSTGHPHDVLAAAGLVPSTIEELDAAAGVTLTRWWRP